MPTPLRWDAEVRAAVTQAARNYGVTLDPALVHGVIEKETIHGALPITGTTERNGISYGPMQVLDSTARSLHGISDPSTLAIPSIGIRIGTFELARLVKLFPGDINRAISAYNAGAGNSARNPTTGRFINQAYVDAVRSFWARFAGAASSAAPAAVAIAAAALVWWLGRRRRRGVRRAA